MKKFDLVLYLSAEFRYICREEKGIRLMSTNKNLSDVIVDFSREKYIKSIKG